MTVRLLSAPTHPLETLWVVWEQSRHNDPVPSPQDVATLIRVAGAQDYVLEGCDVDKMLVSMGYSDYRDRVSTEVKIGEFRWNFGLKTFADKFWKTVEQLFSEDIPVTENLSFVLLLENVPISLREQLVRHRIGSKIGPRMGADYAPDLAESAWWSQTTRVLDLSKFYEDGFFFVPDGLEDKYIEVEQSAYGPRSINPLLEYHRHMKRTQDLYHDLVSAGTHVEDARQIIPLGMTHRLTWEVNLKALSHIIGKRSCWIAQLGIWGDLIKGIANELATKVHPQFRKIVNPPCIKGNCFTSCPFDMINRERIDGRDGSMAPCPLWLYHNVKEAKFLQSALREQHLGDVKAQMAENVCSQFPKWFEVSPFDDPDLEVPDYIDYYGNQDKREGEPRTGEHLFPGNWVTQDLLAAQMMTKGRRQFAELWNRDVDTGDLLPEKAGTGGN